MTDEKPEATEAATGLELAPEPAAPAEVLETGMAAVPVPDPAGGAEPTPLELLRRERDELRDQALRRRADFENFRRRVERDRQAAGVEALAQALSALVPTLDNLERALATEAPELSLREGVKLIHKNLLAALEGLGLKVDDPRSARFDPERHQALTHESVSGFAEGTVVEVFGKGYSLGDRLLRPALVKVAKGEPGPETLD